MQKRLAIVLILIVVAPLTALSLLAVKIAKNEQSMARNRIEELLTERMTTSKNVVDRLMDERQRQLADLVTLPTFEPESLRARLREAPFVEQIFVQDVGGELIYPDPKDAISQAERAFLLRTEQLWTDMDTVVHPSEVAPKKSAPQAQWGWYTWYWENGLSLIYWRRDASGKTIGAELNRIRLLADVIAELPATDVDATVDDGRAILRDARGHSVYQWGIHEPAPGESAQVELALGEPLGAWKLSYFMSHESINANLGSGATTGMLAGLFAVGLALAGLAFYLFRESTREIREAQDRVSFVNQVSHELKTPLTNIRMYAEMLEGEIDENDTKAQRHLGIIVSESQRLTRLIGNVLTFARQHRGALKLRPTPAIVDDVVNQVLTQFGPSLRQKAIVAQTKLDAPTQVRVDTDLLAQILANLFSNIEKYAAAGKCLAIETSQSGPITTITVADRGSGIPANKAEEVFFPFVRLRNDITEGTSGAGIGLGLARDLARLHGGDLVLLPSERGALWLLTLHAPSVVNPNNAPADADEA